MKLQNTFVGSKMNKETDERLLKKGEYPHAENLRVLNTDSSDAGAVENVMGNKKLTDLNLTNAETIGAFADDSNQKLYFFIASDERDLFVEYDLPNSQTNIILESTNPDGVLGLSKNHLITGLVKVINGDSDKDLFAWTDDNKPPRCVNIERAKTYGVDNFTEDDISLIKRPPIYAPDTDLTYSDNVEENNLENKFVAFAYRFKYLDGERSALSPFSNYCFAPNQFELDYQTGENLGMVNSFNAVKVGFNTGSKRVTDIEIVFKESNSNTVYLIETFNKEDEGWSDDQPRDYIFSNSKIYKALPEFELFRTYDNVPRLAKALDLVGNRLVLSNYLEGYDLVNKYGDEIFAKYDVSLLSKDLSGEELETTFVSVDFSDDAMVFDIGDTVLAKDTRITLDVTLIETTYNGSFSKSYDFILGEDYANANELAQSPEFILFVEQIMISNFEQNYSTAEVPEHSELLEFGNFNVSSSTETTITIQAPTVTYRIDTTPEKTDDPENFIDEVVRWSFNTSTSRAYFKVVSIDYSAKTNRSYEVGVVYRDGHARASTTLTDSNNTLYIPQKFSRNQNKLVVNIHNQAPEWAETYKLVVKQNKGEYHTVYATIFYEDGVYRWVKLEGDAKDKVKEGDTLIAKSDMSGAIDEVRKVKVLEISSKPRNFIEDNISEMTNSEIIEGSGLYMKIKPNSLDMNTNMNTFMEYHDNTKTKSGRPNCYLGGSRNIFTGGSWTGDSLAGYYDEETSSFVDYPITSGSRIKMRFHAYESDSYDEKYEKDFIVQNNHDNFEQWFLNEVGDLGVQSSNIWWEFIRVPEDNRLVMKITSAESGAEFERSKLDARIEIHLSEGLMIFETDPIDNNNEIFYETAQTFDIVDGKHMGNVQDQTDDLPATIESDFFNCYVMGNGAESYRYKDAFNQKFLNIDLRPTSTSLERYKSVRRFADFTWSGVYNENNNINGLNEFNLATLNFKEDLEKRYGQVQYIKGRDTDLLVFQDDKVSRVLYGKGLLMNADGTSNITKMDTVLDQQVPYVGIHGTQHPESIAFNANDVYFADVKRGTHKRLGASGVEEINQGMKSWWKENFRGALNTKKPSAFDPFYDQLVTHSNSEQKVRNMVMECSENILRNDFYGVMEVEVDFGLVVGQAGISFSSNNGVPVKYNIEWNGTEVSSGFVGDSEFSQDLVDLGYLPVSDEGTGTLVFNKNLSTPRKAKLTITAPICGANFEVAGTCVVADDISVVSVVLNDELDQGSTIVSKYKWSNDSYISPYKNYNSIFEGGEVDIFEVNSGNEGTIHRPLTGGIVTLEAYNGYNQTMNFIDGNKLGYLITDTEYTEEQYADVVSQATFPEAVEVVSGNGDTTKKIQFPFNRPNGEDFLYLIWDYRNDKPEINQDTKIRIYFDASGSMNSTLTPLQTMKDTLLKDRLLPLYNNDEALYDSSVEVISIGASSEHNERTLSMLDMLGETPEGNAISLVFQDEASFVYHGTSIEPRTASYDNDLANFRSRLDSFDGNYYRGVIFQVNGNPMFRSLVTSIQDGIGEYAGANGLSDRQEINYKYDIADGETPQYYLDKIVEALTELGYEL